MNNQSPILNTTNKKLNFIDNNLLKKCWKNSFKNRVIDDNYGKSKDGRFYKNFEIEKQNNSGKNEVVPDDQVLVTDYLRSAVMPGNRKIDLENKNLYDIDYNFSKGNKSSLSNEGEKSDDDEIKNSPEDTFQRAAGPILFLAQFFALMPVMNVLSPNTQRLRFSYKSLHAVGCLFFMCSSSILTITILKDLLKQGINAKNVVGFIFFTCTQVSCTLFALLAPRWPKIMRYWSQIEAIFTQKPYEMLRPGLIRRVRLSAVVIILCATVEHGLSLAGGVVSYKRRIILCNYTEEISFEDFLRGNYSYVFEMVPYNFYVGVFIMLINGACTFIWNYMDLFTMMISKGLAYRFEQITKRINTLEFKDVVAETVFIEIREHYVKLCEFLDFIDENLSGIILLSCMNNLYFICYQLLNVFNKLRWPINYIYFWYSLLYLIGRTSFVFLTAASINDQSKGGLPVLRKVSSRSWCVEVERLIFQMTTQTVALSGKKFYYLTRRLLFGMAGTIVTYELVLLQFDEPNRVKGLPDLCS